MKILHISNCIVYNLTFSLSEDLPFHINYGFKGMSFNF